MASQRPAVSTGIRQGNPLPQPFSRSHSNNAKASCCAGTAGTVPAPIPQPAKRQTGFIGAEALPRTGGRELLLVPPSVGGISPISNPPLLFNELPLMVISSPPLVPSRATPDTKFPQPATEEQQAVIGSHAAHFCGLRMDFSFFIMRRKEERRIEISATRPQSQFFALHIYTWDSAGTQF